MVKARYKRGLERSGLVNQLGCLFCYNSTTRDVRWKRKEDGPVLGIIRILWPKEDLVIRRPRRRRRDGRAGGCVVEAMSYVLSWCLALSVIVIIVVVMTAVVAAVATAGSIIIIVVLVELSTLLLLMLEVLHRRDIPTKLVFFER
jgi:hypothetical protein